MSYVRKWAVFVLYIKNVEVFELLLFGFFLHFEFEIYLVFLEQTTNALNNAKVGFLGGRGFCGRVLDIICKQNVRGSLLGSKSVESFKWPTETKTERDT